MGSNPIESTMRIRLEAVPARAHTPFHVGSSPTSATIIGALAHLVERNAGSVEVAGSIPAGSISSEARPPREGAIGGGSPARGMYSDRSSSLQGCSPSRKGPITPTGV